MTSRNELLEELVFELLERFGVLADTSDDAEELSTDSIAGLEAYVMELEKPAYVIFPEDVQMLLQEITSVLYDNYRDENYLPVDEFDTGLEIEFTLDPRPVRDEDEQ